MDYGGTWIQKSETVIPGRAILEQMLIDEEKHGTAARRAGGADLPEPVRSAMTAMAGIMKQVTYRI